MEFHSSYDNANVYMCNLDSCIIRGKLQNTYNISLQFSVNNNLTVLFVTIYFELQFALTRRCVVVRAARPLDGAVHVGAVQGPLAHAVYRVRPLPAAQHHGRVADDHQHADWSHLLRPVRRPRYHAHTVVRHVQEAVPGEGGLVGFSRLPLRYSQGSKRGSNASGMIRMMSRIGFNTLYWDRVLQGCRYGSVLSTIQRKGGGRALSGIELGLYTGIQCLRVVASGCGLSSQEDLW